jgi:hypothetical protein
VKKRNILSTLGISVILWGAAVVAVNTTSAASCVPATGFSGFVHKALFAPTGNCTANSAGGCASPNSACTVSAVSGNGRGGICALVSGSCKCVLVK